MTDSQPSVISGQWAIRRGGQRFASLALCLQAILLRPLVPFTIAFALGLYWGQCDPPALAGTTPRSVPLLFILAALVLLAGLLSLLRGSPRTWVSVLAAAVAVGVLWGRVRNLPPPDDVATLRLRSGQAMAMGRRVVLLGRALASVPPEQNFARVPVSVRSVWVEDAPWREADLQAGSPAGEWRGQQPGRQMARSRAHSGSPTWRGSAHLAGGLPPARTSVDGPGAASSLAGKWRAPARTPVARPGAGAPSWPGAYPPPTCPGGFPLQMDVGGRVVVQAFAPPELSEGEDVIVIGRLTPPERPLNPGQFDERAFYARRYSAFSKVPNAFIAPTGARRGRGFQHWGAAVRASVGRKMAEQMPGPNRHLRATLASAAVYGVTYSQLPASIEDSFRKAGTIHVLVVSGTQVSLVALAVLALLRWRRVPRWARAAAASLAILVYAWVATGEASIFRAAVMGLVLVIALVGRQNYDVWSALSLAALILLFVDPAALFSIGFQLSVAAVLGIGLFLADPYRSRRSGAPTRRNSLRWIALIVAASAAAFFATTPLLMHYFHQAAPIGILSNAIVVPTAGLLTLVGLVNTPLLFLWPGAATRLCAVAGALVDWMVRTSAAAAQVPAGHFDHLGLSASGVWLWYGALGLIWALWHLRVAPSQRLTTPAFPE